MSACDFSTSPLAFFYPFSISIPASTSLQSTVHQMLAHNAALLLRFDSVPSRPGPVPPCSLVAMPFHSLLSLFCRVAIGRCSVVSFLHPHFDLHLSISMNIMMVNLFLASASVIVVLRIPPTPSARALAGRGCEIYSIEYRNN